jgi:excisionase family DNA binding protein
MPETVHTTDAKQSTGPKPLLKAEEVAELTRLALPTIYEQARENPERLGVVRIGRAVRFKPDAIDRLVGGES